MKELTVNADIVNIQPMTSFLEEYLKENGCPDSDILRIDIAVDEILSNICQYAYPNGEKGYMTMKLELIDEGEGVRMFFLDGGIPYDPLKKRDPDVSLSIENRPIGGLGIYIVKKTMDNVFYEYAEGRNCLTVEKSWKS